MKKRVEDHRLYSTWKSMRSRCNNPNVECYHRYGGRGITICKRWDDFKLFLEDMEPTYVEGLTLDRKDPNGNYEPSNCRWATHEEQMNNQANCLKLLFEGEFYTESQLSKKTGVPRTTIQKRRNMGWSVYEMVYGKEGAKSNTPLQIPFEGKVFNLSELHRYTGIDKSTLRYRIFKKGMSVEDATYDRKK